MVNGPSGITTADSSVPSGSFTAVRVAFTVFFAGGLGLMAAGGEHALCLRGVSEIEPLAARRGATRHPTSHDLVSAGGESRCACTARRPVPGPLPHRAIQWPLECQLGETPAPSASA